MKAYALQTCRPRSRGNPNVLIANELLYRLNQDGLGAAHGPADALMPP